jgi:transcriptional regulator with XRE-family HTH domain
VSTPTERLIALIKATREVEGLNQSDVARLAGMSQQFINRLEAGTTGVSFDYGVKLMESRGFFL